jgi:hypothetical protein
MRIVLILVALATALFLSACSDQTVESDKERVEATLNEYYDGLRQKDPQVCGLLTEDLQADLGGRCELVASGVGGGVVAEDYDFSGIRITGDTAIASAAADYRDLDTIQNWTVDLERVDDEWLIAKFTEVSPPPDTSNTPDESPIVPEATQEELDCGVYDDSVTLDEYAQCIDPDSLIEDPCGLFDDSVTEDEYAECMYGEEPEGTVGTTEDMETICGLYDDSVSYEEYEDCLVEW